MLNCSPWAIAADNAPLSDTKIVHQPADAAPAGIPLTVTTTVEDSAGVEVVRVYFKSTVGTIYYYVPLVQGKDNAYSGTIPAPAADAGTIEYLILVKNKKNVVVKSQQYQTPVTEKTGQPHDGKQKTIKVYSESPHASKYITGFTDGYDFQVADPSEKYGVVAGLYNPESVSWIATDAVAGGTAAQPAKTETNWTPYLIGAGAIAGIAVVAMALGGGGGGGGGGDDTSQEPTTPVTPPATETPLASGTWRLTSYQNTASCTSGTGATQTVTCTATKTFDSVSPSTVAVTVPDTATPGTCIAGTTPGLAAVFIAGQNCDAVEACNNFSSSNLTSKTCETTSITIVRDSGAYTEVWQKQ